MIMDTAIATPEPFDACLECIERKDDAHCARQRPCRECGTVPVTPCSGSWICKACQKRAIWAAFKDEMLSFGCLLRDGEGNIPAVSCRFSKSNAAYEQAAHKYAQNWTGKSNAIISGPVGVGKSFLARCMLNRVLETALLKWMLAHDPVMSKPVLRNGEGLVIAEYAASDICARVDAGYQSESPDFLIAPQYLLLDDLDKGRWNERSITTLFRAVDARYQIGGRYIIVTSNFGPVELAKWLKQRIPQNATTVDAIFDRLRPMLPLEIRGKSLRK